MGKGTGIEAEENSRCQVMEDLICYRKWRAILIFKQTLSKFKQNLRILSKVRKNN